MIENVFEKMGGIGVFGVVSISIFFAFFTGMLIYAALLKPRYLDSMRALPLEEPGEDARSKRSAADSDVHPQA